MNNNCTSARHKDLGDSKDRVCKYCRPLHFDGNIYKEGSETHFVTNDLEYKIRSSSRNSKRSCLNTPLNLSLIRQGSVFDVSLLEDLESDLQCLAVSINDLIENLYSVLQNVSLITVSNLNSFANTVSKISGGIDDKIKNMFIMLVKLEEITQAMETAKRVSTRLEEIKALVSMFERCM